MELLHKLEEATISKILSIIIGSIVIACSSLGVLLWNLLPDELTGKSEIIIVLESLLLILMLALFLGTWIHLLYKKLKEKPDFTGFKHNPDKQCWINEKTNQRICEACKSNNKLTPLSKFSTGGWRCPLHTDFIVDHPYQKSNTYINFDE
jgi:hypothetical protein